MAQEIGATYGSRPVTVIAVMTGSVILLADLVRQLAMPLRVGVLYDLLGRYHHHDLRDATVSAFVRRYNVDLRQAQQVADTACHLLALADTG